ncbi:MAG TPA: response regulator, partial [Bacteroidia bacterium]|nr:response regulator [Bacteroidia bacterium]
SILWQDGYKIVRANSGKDALKILLKDFDFTLILMDVEMPDLNGFETATMIYQREKLKHIPIIFITAHSYGDDNLFKGYRAGAVDYIYKPIQPNLLRAKVMVFAELYRKNHQLMSQEQKLVAINKNLEIEIKDRIASEEKVKELNKQLLENINELESTNKELDRFAFMASHDLQEPIRKIRIFSNRINEKYSNLVGEEGRLYIDKMQAACERMQNLITDILAFSKIEVTKDSLVYSDVGLLLGEVVSEMDHRIQEKKALVKIEKLPQLYVNPVLIKSLFQNLISNSLKYSQKDVDPVISITTKMDASVKAADSIAVKKYWRIYVQDNGIGFEQQYAEQIFTMFTRLHIGSEYTGTGIGLAICKKIVEEHQGYISAKSAINKGTLFVISLPVHAYETKAHQLVN